MRFASEKRFARVIKDTKSLSLSEMSSLEIGNDAKKVPTPKSLGVQSRATIVRNVKHEDLDSLPLPQAAKDECFENVAVDRSDDPVRRSLDPCSQGCCSFPSEQEASKIRDGYQIRDWSESSKWAHGAHLVYSDPLPGLPTNADWLELPDRDSLLELYRSSDPCRRERLEACLNTLRFDPTTGLGDAHLWIRRFLFHRNHSWFHVSVSARLMKSFLEAVEDANVVVLPYGCVTDGGAWHGADERTCLEKHRRRMILVVKDGDYEYNRALKRVDYGMETQSSFYGPELTSTRIRDAGHFVNTIAYVSRAKFDKGNFEKHYVIFNPVIWHAIWWMHLLVPGGHLDRFANFRIWNGFAERTTPDGKKRAHASTELEVENCVVRFDPPYQIVGDPVESLEEQVSQNPKFVYFLGGRVLNVKEMSDVPQFVASSDDPKRRFLEWCVSRQMNTLLNLNGYSWVDVSNKRPKLYQSSFKRKTRFGWDDDEEDDYQRPDIGYDLDYLDKIDNETDRLAEIARISNQNDSDEKDSDEHSDSEDDASQNDSDEHRDSEDDASRNDSDENSLHDDNSGSDMDESSDESVDCKVSQKGIPEPVLFKYFKILNSQPSQL